MNHKLKIAAVLILIGAFAYKACKKDEGIYADSNARKSVVERNIILSGEWNISYFKLNGIDRTKEFDQAKFRFDQDGTVIVSHKQTEMKGIWSIGANDDPHSFSLQFNNGTLTQFNGAWVIQKAEKIILDTDRPGKAGSAADVLDFEKIVESNASSVKDRIP